MSSSAARVRVSSSNDLSAHPLTITGAPTPQTSGPNGLAVREENGAHPEGPSQALATLSPSRAGDFKQCPRLYRYRSIDRLPEPPSPPQARGTTAHLALERLFDEPADQRTAERLFDLFREAWTGLRATSEYEGLFENLDEEREWGIQSLKVMANYLTLEDPVAITPLDRELRLSEDLGEVTIRGILDRLDEQADGELVVIDYKTGSAPSTRYALNAFFALKIYALLVQRHFGRTPTELRLIYLGNSTVYSIKVDSQMLEGMERQILALARTIRRAIKQDNFPPRPSVLCRWCAFRDICPAVDATGEPLPQPAAAAG